MAPFERIAVITAAALTLCAAAPAPAGAAVRAVVDAFTATTTSMTPADLVLRIQVLEWSDDSARADVVATLEDAPALGKLATVGYLWPAGSPVGYTVKYAHRTKTADGRDRLTFVTDRAIGSYDYKKWSVAGTTAKPLPYSVVELYVDAAGNGTGNLSLAAEVTIDAATNTITLTTGGSHVLTSVVRQPSRQG
jgi:hypothetical protein